MQAIFCLGWSHELSCTELTDPQLSALALFPRMHIVGYILLDLDLQYLTLGEAGRAWG